MEKIRFDVVGLFHWDVHDYWKEYATEAVGKKLTLQPQPENVKDRNRYRIERLLSVQEDEQLRESAVRAMARNCSANGFIVAIAPSTPRLSNTPKARNSSPNIRKQHEQ